MKFLRNALDDRDKTACGLCVMCRPDLSLPGTASRSLGIKAVEYLRHSEIPLEAKKMIPKNAFPIYGFQGNLKRQGLGLETGRILSRWCDAGWGQLVADNKHKGSFDDTLVDAAISMILESWRPDPFPRWVTCVPSLNHPKLVPEFAEKLARKLGIPFLDAIIKVKHNEPQKGQNNSFQQCRNIDGVFEIQEDIFDKCVLLVDDIVDSGWTLTVVGALLRKAGCSRVYPLALATTGGG